MKSAPLLCPWLWKSLTSYLQFSRLQLHIGIHLDPIEEVVNLS